MDAEFGPHDRPVVHGVFDHDRCVPLEVGVEQVLVGGVRHSVHLVHGLAGDALFFGERRGCNKVWVGHQTPLMMQRTPVPPRQQLHQLILG